MISVLPVIAVVSVDSSGKSDRINRIYGIGRMDAPVLSKSS